MPIDISFIRKNPELVKESEFKRFRDPKVIDLILELDSQWRSKTGQIDQIKKQKNQNQKQIAQYYKSSQPELANELKQSNSKLDSDIQQYEKEQDDLFVQIQKLVNQIGNIVGSDVIISKNEEQDNQIIKTWGSPSPSINTDKTKLNHHVLLEKIGGFEPERGTKVAGHKGYFLKDIGVLLNQALVNYSLSFLKIKSYTLLQPPYFMNKEMMSDVAQLSEFDESLYHVKGGEQDSYLIATSEQPICAYHSGEWFKESELPKLYAGYSPCFRKEAGSHGKDVWGIFRVHQFDKIEQFVICEDNQETSDKFQKQMLEIAEEFYQSLEIPYRIVNIVSGELNNAAIRKYDLEGWFPGYNAYRELVSCSNCTDYQSRSMDIRVGLRTDKNEAKRYVHMLNSTLCACTRVICCILELYQTEIGIKVPKVLQPYLAGLEFIPFVK
jgi:seryl-tRNA synthetase